ncbi:hypothetical protein, partial [Endozoicomonas atrinae]|uniref:hypothetical protein n=1 Tax=Endozoicomonas atrinae TaxID=1333660 RepID=UPI001112F366
MSNTAIQEAQSIESLEQAELMIRRAGIVIDEMVEGEKLLEICGFNQQNPKQKLDRQIERHGFEKGKDFTATISGYSRGQAVNCYLFTMNAANHVLLSAMTPKGKKARQEAIDSKMKQMESEQTNISQTTNQTAIIAQVENIAAVYHSMKTLSESIEPDGNIRQMAATATEKLTGYDVMDLLGLSANLQEMKPKAAQQINITETTPINQPIKSKKPRFTKGRYQLDNFLTLTELAELLEWSVGDVKSYLIGANILEYGKRPGPYQDTSKNSRYILTKKGWEYGTMYEPQTKRFRTTADSKDAILRSSAQPVFD